MSFAAPLGMHFPSWNPIAPRNKLCRSKLADWWAFGEQSVGL